MATRLILTIHEKISRLTPSEQKLAQVILANQGIVETHTATELASLAEVSKATAARFFRSLGYADFEEAKLQAREERNRTQPYSYSVASSDRVVLGRAIGEHLTLELDNLTRTFEEMRADLLTDAARLILDAPRLWFLGLGLEQGLARQGRVMFSRLRPDVQTLGGREGALAEDLAMTGPRDVLILLTLDPRPKVLGQILAYARTTRMNVITLTDHTYLAQAQRFSKIVFRCHVAHYGLVPTQTTLGSVLRLLALAYAGLAGEPSVQRARIIDEINEELDILE